MKRENKNKECEFRVPLLNKKIEEIEMEILNGGC